MSPFRSKQQRRYLWANHPKIAQKWSDEEKGKARKKAMMERLKKESKS